MTKIYFKITNKFLNKVSMAVNQKTQSRIYCFKFCLIFLPHIDWKLHASDYDNIPYIYKKDQNKIAQQYLLQQQKKKIKEGKNFC